MRDETEDVMKRPLPVVLALVLAGITFAGCIGEETPPQDDTPPPSTASTGGIRGTVLTADLEPLAGAQVALTVGEQVPYETTTAEDGSYLIGQVAPGEYRLQAVSACCRPSVKTVTVVEEQVDQVDFQLIRLTPDELQIPRVDEQKWEGFISCSVKTPTHGAAVCSIPGSVDPALADPNEDFLMEFNVTKGIKTLMVGMEWTSSGGGVTAEQFWLTVDDPDCGVGPDGCTYRYASETGPSPLVLRIDNDDITDPEWTWDQVGTERTIRMRVFAGGDVDVVYQQPFKIHYSVFYWEEAAADHNVFPDA